MATPLIQLDVYSHNFRLSNYDWHVKNILVEYARKFAQFEIQKGGFGARAAAKMKTVYAGIFHSRRQFSFPISVLEDFKRWLFNHDIHEDRVNIIVHEHKALPRVEYVFRQEQTPRDYQVPLLQYLKDPGHNKFVELQTGKGKTFIGLHGIHYYGHRCFIIIAPKFMEKWISDVETMFEMGPNDLVVVRGSKSLKRVFEMGRDKEEPFPKITIISNATWRNFLDEAEIYGLNTNSYEMNPSEVFETCGVGTVLIDEAHLDFHVVYRTMCYTHAPRTIGLSATMDHDDRFYNARYQDVFPKHLRSPVVPFDKYIAMEALFYELNSTQGMKWKNPMGFYNHNLFEQSIIKDKTRLTNYKNMVGGITNFRYMKEHREGMKALVFFESIEMCTIMSEYLTQKFPTKTVVRYVGGDSYEDLLAADIAATTLKSAGTGLDIPDLAYCLMTPFVSSKTANVQGVGRLRVMKNHPDWTPKFDYLVCPNIDKSMKYYEEKQLKLDGRVLVHKTSRTPFRI